MVRHPVVIARVLLPFALLACGGGGSKKPTLKRPIKEVKKAPAPPDNEETREAKRHDAATAIVPDGSTCLPAALKDSGAPRLELSAINGEAIVCALDTDKSRLLGPVACWKVALDTGALAYLPALPLPGRGIAVALDDRCARGFCLPKDAKTSSEKTALMTWNGDASKVAVLVGEDVHVYDASSKAHEKSFTIRGDKGVIGDALALHWVGDALFVEGGDSTSAAVWLFKVDGTAGGPIEAIGSKDGKPLSTFGGSFSLLDKNRVALSEQGFSAVTIYEIDTSKRSKLVRKLTKPPCKNEELDAYWKDQSAAVAPKCKEHLEKNFEHLIGATAVAGSKNLLVLLRGPRLGELAVLDSKTLAEKKAIKLPWCAGDSAAATERGGAGDDKKSVSPKKEKEKEKAKARVDEDPDAGGQ